jgi:hypothetical protein
LARRSHERPVRPAVRRVNSRRMAFGIGSGASWLVAAVLTSGCGGFADDELSTLKTRASFDFQCPKSEIKTVTIDDDTKGVTGCGQRATYVQQCGRQGPWGRDDCKWILNTDATRDHSKKHGSDDEE